MMRLMRHRELENAQFTYESIAMKETCSITVKTEHAFEGPKKASMRK